VTGTIAVITFEIFGCMGLFDIKFSALPAVSLIMSVRTHLPRIPSVLHCKPPTTHPPFSCDQVGVAVEFTAHLVQAFKHSEAADNEARVREALNAMAVPIVNGGVSTMVGLIMLAFSPVRACSPRMCIRR